MIKTLPILLSFGISFLPVTFPVVAQEIIAQTQNAQTEIEQLKKQALQQTGQGDYLKAIETLQKLLTIAQQKNDRELEAFILSQLGRNYNYIGQYQQAIEYLNEALPISREVNDQEVEGITLNNIGYVYQSLGKYEQALDYYQQALAISKKVSNRLVEGVALDKTGYIYQSLGKYEQALNYYQQALAIYKEMGEHFTPLLNNIATVYDSLGKSEQALDYLQQALAISKEVGDRSGEGIILKNLANLYVSLGQPQKALEYYQQALAIHKKVGALAEGEIRKAARSKEGIILNNIGVVYDSLGQYEKALEYYQQSLAISKEMGESSAANLSNIAGVYFYQEKYEQALEYYQQALTITQKEGNRAGESVILNGIGESYRNRGKYEQALEYFQQASTLSKEVGKRFLEGITLNNIGLVYNNLSTYEQALEFYQQALIISKEVGDHFNERTTLGNIGRAYRSLNQPTKAIDYLEQSVTITLKLRRGLLKENRQSFLNTAQGIAIELIDLLIEQNQPQEAFEWANLVTTFDLADYTRLINAKVSDPQAQAALDRWNEKKQQLENLRQKLQTNYSVELAQQFRDFEAKVNLEAENHSKQFPEIAELFETTPADITKLQANISEGTVVIQPVLLENNLALFVLSKDSITVTKVPIDPQKVDTLITEFREVLSDYQQDRWRSKGSELYDVLIRPIEPQLQSLSPKQLAIIATGKLRYIPFETLYDRPTNQYLIQKYPIHYLTRLTTNNSPPSPLAPSNGEEQERQEAITVLAFGNPDSTEPYNLLGAEEEVNGIPKIFPGSEVYIHKTATLSTFKLQAPRFRYLHLATHGCFQQEGCCLPDGACPTKKDLQPDTLLFADDQSFNIKDAALLGLQNTDLIVLSACQTVLSENSNGEEVAGVAYLFERAGASAVMANLGSVDDVSTKEIMLSFYQYLKEGKSKVEALQKAKLDYINNNPGENHPSLWSPIILIGDAQ